MTGCNVTVVTGNGRLSPEPCGGNLSGAIRSPVFCEPRGRRRPQLVYRQFERDRIPMQMALANANPGSILLKTANFFTVDTCLVSTLQSLASSPCVAFRSVNPTPVRFHN